MAYLPTKRGYIEEKGEVLEPFVLSSSVVCVFFMVVPAERWSGTFRFENEPVRLASGNPYAGICLGGHQSRRFTLPADPNDRPSGLTGFLGKLETS